MEDMRNINCELQQLDDMLNCTGQKIHNITDLVGLVYLGMMKLSGQEDSYELSTLSIIEDYLKSLYHEDITKMHDRLTELKSKYHADSP